MADRPHIGPTQDSLAAARWATSPRHQPRRIAWPALLIHGGLTLLWAGLLLRALVPVGIAGWAVGLVYIGYDTVLLLFVLWQTRHLWRAPQQPAPAAGNRPSLAVVVAAHDEDQVIEATLRALLDQSDPADAILIADDGSTDGTPRLLTERFGLTAPPLGQCSSPSATEPQLRWLRLPQGGKAMALNRALALVAEDVVVTLDADTLIDSGALAAIRQAFAADRRLVAATGILLPVCDASVSGQLFEWFQTYEYLRNFLSRYAWGRLDCLLLISGAFAGFKREALVEVGGFELDCLVEDYELIHRLRRHGARHGRGWTTTVLGSARARTEAPATLVSFLRQRRRWFGGFLQTQSWYRDMIGQPRFGALGLFMLPVKAADTLQPIYGLAAAALLIADVVRGKTGVATIAITAIGVKLAIDLLAHAWLVLVFRRWLGERARTSLPAALAATLVEPFCFQLLRHCGAALGWVTYLSGRASWGRQSRGGLAAAAATDAMRVRWAIRRVSSMVAADRATDDDFGSRSPAKRCLPSGA